MRYFDILLPQHDVIYANGLESESFYPGFQGILTLQTKALAHLRKILLQAGFMPAEHHYGPTARRFLTKRDADILIPRLLRDMRKSTSERSSNSRIRVR